MEVSARRGVGRFKKRFTSSSFSAMVFRSSGPLVRGGVPLSTARTQEISCGPEIPMLVRSASCARQRRTPAHELGLTLGTFGSEHANLRTSERAAKAGSTRPSNGAISQ